MSTHNARTGPLMLAGFVLAVALSLALHRGTLDDLYITFTYARNLAEGRGFSIWNVGEAPVEGSTSTVWMVLLALGMKLGIAPFWSSMVMGALSFGGLVALFLKASACRAQGVEDVYPGAPAHMLSTAALLCLTYIPLAWYGATGMESTFFALQLAALLLSPALFTGTVLLAFQAALAMLMVLTRPEGMLLAPLLCGYFWWTRSARKPTGLLPMGVAVAAVAGLTIFRLWYFGDPFPNTYYAKAAGALDHHMYWGVRSLSRFLGYNLPAWIIIAAGMYKAWKAGMVSRLEGFLSGVVLFYFVYMLKSGGDPESAFPLWRHFVHIAPIWLLLGACAIERLANTKRQHFLLTAGFVLMTQATLSVKYIEKGMVGMPSFSQTDSDTPFFEYIASVSDHQTVAAAGYAGHWGWYFPGKVIDIWGLNNRHIAHFGEYQKFGELDSKSDMAYVFSQKPDLVNLDIPPQEVMAVTCPRVIIEGGRSQALRDAISNPTFQTGYYFIANAPYQTYHRALFVSEAYAKILEKKQPSVLIPIEKTALASVCKERIKTP